MKRYIIAAALTGLALSLVFSLPNLASGAAAVYDGGVRPDAAANNSKPYYAHIKPDLTDPIELESPTGTDVVAKGTAGGIAKTTVDGMCLGTCTKLTANQVADGSVATLIPGQWYEFKIMGSGGDGCFSQGSAVVSCTGTGGTMTIEAGERFHEAFTANSKSPDASVNDQSKLYFLATSATTLSVTICPKVPCN